MWEHGSKYTYPQLISQETLDFVRSNEDIIRPINDLDSSKVRTMEDSWTFLKKTTAPWIPVPIDMPWQDIYREAYTLLDNNCFSGHRATDGSGWLSLCIHGLSSVMTGVPEDYGLPNEMEDTHSKWTDIAQFCPTTVDWLKNSLRYDVYTRVRFMVVLPGGWIFPHTDRDSTVGMSAANISINNPKGCKLVMEGWGEMPFTPGSVFKINTGYKHAVWNNSTEPRIHMIVDGDESEYFKDKALEGYKNATK